MSEFKGTKGEWDWMENSASSIHGSTCIEVSVGGPSIAYLQSFDGWDGKYDRDTTIANANLIVAAPELLEALQFIIDDCSRMIPKCAEDKARAAIAKALGETK